MLVFVLWEMNTFLVRPVITSWSSVSIKKYHGNWGMCSNASQPVHIATALCCNLIWFRHSRYQMRIFRSSHSWLKVSMDEQYGCTKLPSAPHCHLACNQASEKERSYVHESCRVMIVDPLDTLMYLLSGSANQRTIASNITTTQFLLQAHLQTSMAFCSGAICNRARMRMWFNQPWRWCQSVHPQDQWHQPPSSNVFCFWKSKYTEYGSWC